jgi:hypothetical protein
MFRARLIFLASWLAVIASFVGMCSKHKFGGGSWSDGH